MKKSTLILFIIFFSACKKQAEKIENMVHQKAETIMNEQEILSLEKLKKHAFETAREKYGNPEEILEFNIKDGLPEFRIELYNIYDENEDILIKEATWKKNSHINITIWYSITEQKDWHPVHGMEWDSSLEF